MSGPPHPALDAESAWRADLLGRMRRVSVWLFAVTLMVTPFGLLLDNLDDPVARQRALWLHGAGVLAAALGIVAMRRVRSWRHLFMVHGLAQPVFSTLLALSTVAPGHFELSVVTFTLVLWATQVTFTWTPWFNVYFFATPAVVFAGTHLITPPEHVALSTVLAAIAYISLAAGICGFAGIEKYRVARRVFLDHHGLAVAHEALTATHASLVQAQQSLVESERMAVLGQLVAGVAHEINSPLGAIRASAETMSEALDKQHHDADEQVQALLDATEPSWSPSTREERAARRALRAALEELDIDAAATKARALLEIRFRGDAGDHVSLLRRPDALTVLERVHEQLTAARCSQTIRDAAGRADKIVQALKSYAHPGEVTGERTHARISEQIETVLTLYQNMIKHGVRVERRFVEGDEVYAHHDKLNQVWTNLIHNALHAMAGRGTLRVEVAAPAEGDVLHVRVEDTGPGIAPEHHERVFEPFFTTKAAGEGTGLGLSLSRDIVRAHGGDITLRSQPGRTTLLVTLPRGASMTADQLPPD